jgi:DNA-binding GntR family transcriptional regulator
LPCCDQTIDAAHWNLVYQIPVGVSDTKLQLPSRAAAVADELERAILSGEIRPGEPLVERTLAESFGISKTPVREALKVLSHRGFVEAAPYRAIRVRLISAQEARHIYQVRSLIEPEAVRLAVPYHDEESLRRAAAALDAAEAAKRDLAAKASANRRFHRALYEPCPNRLLCSLADGIQGQVALISVTAWMNSSTWTDEAAEHSAILLALRSGDPELAAGRLRNHIEKFTTNIATGTATNAVSSEI